LTGGQLVFGSYYYSKTKDADGTASEMGNSAQMVFAHYRAVVKPEATKEIGKLRTDHPAKG
jgi:hypothetical protein